MSKCKRCREKVQSGKEKIQEGIRQILLGAHEMNAVGTKSDRRKKAQNKG